ncbi:P-loop NTPase [Motilimonas cestriensis]|uniref:P-loop NTPase n=1 Tax=Motilimonas cestriensis TaxID=2742685 RepID=A0ABS8WCH7_9GAMM|nr:P-loop NTPase [Motilimonas cestriensis]MCE2596752.1 P-loop NTPase [Motilimonas cestriensis]
MAKATTKMAVFVLANSTEYALKLALAEQDQIDAAIQLGTIAQAKQWCIKHGAPDILIVDAGDCSGLALALSDLAQVCPPQMKLLVLGDKKDVNLYRQLLFSGVNDYHSTPVDIDALRASIRHLLGQPVTQSLRQGRIICVVGCAGGSGTSTVAANLAWLMATEQNQQVALVDLDVFHSQHPILLGVDYEPALNNILQQPDRIDATLLAHSAHQVTDKLHLFYDQNSHFSDASAAQLGQCIHAIAEHYSTLIVDLPDLRQPAMLDVLAQADLCIYMNNLSLNSFRYLSKLQASGQSQQRKLLVANQDRQRSGRVNSSDLGNGANLSVALTLPFEAKAFEQSERLGQPIAAQSGKFAKGLRELLSMISMTASARG